MAGEGRDSKLVWALALLSLIAIVSIAHMKPSLELEDAEQAYYAQWWRLGYDDQPPLYTWLQKGLNAIFGLSKFSLSLLRGLLFATILLALFHLGRKTLRDRERAEWAVLASALLPVFIDFAFRRLSHTLLLTLAVVLTTLAVARLVERKSLWNYLLLGGCLGFGMLSKYNYILYVAALALTAGFTKETRRLLISPGILLSLSLGLLLFAPHLSWILTGGNLQAIHGSVQGKIGQGPAPSILGTLWDSLMAFLDLAWPLLLVTALLLLLKKARFSRAGELRWLYRWASVQLVLLPLVFILGGVERIESRWMLPLLFPQLVLWSGSLRSSLWPLKRLGTLLFLALLAFQLVRTPMERLLGIGSDIQFDYSGLSKVLKAHYPAGPWVLPDVTYGGQLRLLNPDRRILTLDDFSLPQDRLPPRAGMLLRATDLPLGHELPLDGPVGQGPDKEDLYLLECQDLESHFPKG